MAKCYQNLVKHLSRRLLLMLALLAMLGAQLGGIHRGYVCDCGGVERLTLLDHCHGPHDHDCESEEHDLPDHDRDDHDEEEPVHEHPPLIESLQAENVPGAALAVPHPALIVFLPLDSIGSKNASPNSKVRLQPPRQNTRAGPLWPLRLSRSIALLI